MIQCCTEGQEATLLSVAVKPGTITMVQHQDAVAVQSSRWIGKQACSRKLNSMQSAEHPLTRSHSWSNWQLVQVSSAQQNNLARQLMQDDGGMARVPQQDGEGMYYKRGEARQPPCPCEQRP